MELYQTINGDLQTVQLPQIGSPNETIEITWRVKTPEDKKINGKVDRRRHRLSRLLNEASEQGCFPSYQHLADALGVSLRTIERDMAVLKDSGTLNLFQQPQNGGLD